MAISLATGHVYRIKATKAARRGRTYVLKAIGGEPIFAVPAPRSVAERMTSRVRRAR